MPNLFRPSVARGAARGLRVVEGEVSAAARARALRASAAHRVQPEYTLIQEGAERTFRGHTPGVGVAIADDLARRAGARYSPRATAAQAMRAEALKRHAGKVEDPRAWAGEVPPVGEEVRYQAGMERQLSKSEEEELLAQVKENIERRRRGLGPLTPEENTKLMSDLGPKRKGVPEDLDALRAARAEALKRSRGYGAPGTAARQAQWLDRFERKYGWRPDTWDDAERMLTPQQLSELTAPWPEP